MALKDLFSDANESQAAEKRMMGFDQGRTNAFGQLDQGYNAAAGDYSQALGLYGDLSALGKSGSSMYSNALGLNGPEGNAAATSAFQTGPGYQFQLEQGLDALDRRAASRGMLGSGNNSLDTLNYANGLASQEYGSWLDRLSGLTDLSRGVAGDQAGILTGRGNLSYGLGTTKAGIDYDTEVAKREAQAKYLEGRDQTGANVIGTVAGGISLGAKLLGLGGFGA